MTIYYLVSKRHQYTINRYLAHWGINLIPRLRLLVYEDLDRLTSLPLGTYIFSDIERLTPKQAEMAAEVWEKLSSAGKGIRLLNHPNRSMRRYELLRTLYERGLNQFNVYRLTEPRKPERFPVFLRGENDHKGNQTPLLKSLNELDNVIALFHQQGKRLNDKIITEFCDTSDEKGTFRKYAAFMIGDQIIPRGILFGQQWMLKSDTNSVTSEQTLWEEEEYIKTNPHESQLREIFRLANIQYGRIDYSMLNGVPQVWEINTNPGALRIVSTERMERVSGLPISEFFSKQFELAFEAIDCKPDSTAWIPIWTNPRTSFSQKTLAGRTNKGLLLLEYVLSLMPPWAQILIFQKFIAFKNNLFESKKAFLKALRLLKKKSAGVTK